MRTVLSLCLFFSMFSTFSQTDFPLETVLQKGHTDYIRAYDFSENNQFVITGGFDNIVILWNVESGKQIRTFSGHTERIKFVEISPDQMRFLSVAADNTIKVFEINSGRQLHEFSVTGRELSTAHYSPSGTYIYGLDKRDHVYVWKVETGKLIGEFRKEYGAHHEPSIIDPDESSILSYGNAKKAFKIDLVSGDTLLRFDFDKPYSQSFSPDGRYIAISSEKLLTAVYDAITGELISEFRDGEVKCDGCNMEHVFSPDSKYIVTMSNKTDGILWDIKSGKVVKRFSQLREYPNQIKFSPSGNTVLISFDKEAFVFDSKTGKTRIHIESDRIEYFDFRFSANGRFIASPGPNGELEIWNVSTGKIGRTIKGYLNHEKDNGMTLSYTKWLDRGILKYIQHKRKVLLSPDNKSVVFGGVDTSAMQVDIETGRVLNVFKGHSKSVIAYDFTPDGKILATGGGDRKIKFWDVETGEEIKTISRCRETIFDLKFSADGKYLLSGSWDGFLRIWDWQADEFEYVDFNNNSPYCVGFSPNELYVVTGDLDRNIRFWERDTRESFRTLIGHTGIPSGFDFSPDSKAMVTASWDGSVKVWDVLTGMLTAKMDQHNGQVYAVQYDPKGRFIVSGGADNRIVLWNPESNEVLAELIGHSTAVTSLAVTNDGKRLVSMSIDGLMKLWDLETYKEIYSRVQMSRDQWLATNPAGYFDGSSKALGWVNYVKGNQVVNISSLFDKYYSPGLLKELSEGNTFNDRGELEEQMKNIPTITLALGGGNKRSVITDSIYTSLQNKVPVEITVNNQSVPLDEVRIYNNGKLVIRESTEEDIVFRGGEGKTHLYEVPLSNGVNKIRAVVVNTDRSESIPQTVTVNYNGEAAKTDLFIVSIGINAYKNPIYNLEYAVNDSKSFSRVIKKGADSLFNAVFVYNINNENATKVGINEIIYEIQEKIGPEDVFLFYYAGHGVMSLNETTHKSDFYIVTHDVTNLYGSNKLLAEKAVSASELMQIAMNTRAEKQLFILDACHSGGVLDALATRGSQREKALAQLARSTGTFFLTASQDAQFANEAGKLNHGLFTYALLEMLKGEVPGNEYGNITVSELKAYVEERVPELTQTYHGSPQYPTGYSFGNDFPIVIVR